MKRVVLSLVGGSCLLFAATAMGQTSVLVAQKESNGQNEEKKPLRAERICLDWPYDFIDENTVLYLCEDWPDFKTCDDDPQAAYEYLSPTPNYPSDCGIPLPSDDPLACRQSHDKGKKFYGLFALQKADTDLRLKVTEHLVLKPNGTPLGTASAQVLYQEPTKEGRTADRYTYINANLPKSPKSKEKETVSVPGIVYHIQVRNPPGYSKPMKNFYLALECEDSERTKKAPPLDFYIVRKDQRTDPPYFAFKSKEPYGEGEEKGPILMLTYTAVGP